MNNDTPRTDAKGWYLGEGGIDPDFARDLERENNRLHRVAKLARDAVEAGAIDECYLSLLRDALDALPNAASEPRPKAVGSDGLFDGPAKDSRK